MLGHGTLRDAELHGQRPDTERAVGDQAKDAQAHLDGQCAQQAGNIGKVFHGLL